MRNLNVSKDTETQTQLITNKKEAVVVPPNDNKESWNALYISTFFFFCLKFLKPNGIKKKKKKPNFSNWISQLTTLIKNTLSLTCALLVGSRDLTVFSRANSIPGLHRRDTEAFRSVIRRWWEPGAHEWLLWLSNTQAKALAGNDSNVSQHARNAIRFLRALRPELLKVTLRWEMASFLAVGWYVYGREW